MAAEARDARPPAAVARRRPSRRATARGTKARRQATAQHARRPAPSPGVTAREAGTAPARPEALPPAAAGSTAAPPAKKDAPRLRISAAPAAAGGTGGRAIRHAECRDPGASELAQALEAETVVLRQRVAELSAMVDRMQQEIARGDRGAPSPPRQPPSRTPLAVAVRGGGKPTGRSSPRSSASPRWSPAACCWRRRRVPIAGGRVADHRACATIVSPPARCTSRSADR